MKIVFTIVTDKEGPLNRKDNKIPIAADPSTSQKAARKCVFMLPPGRSSYKSNYIEKVETEQLLQTSPAECTGTLGLSGNRTILLIRFTTLKH